MRASSRRAEYYSFQRSTGMDAFLIREASSRARRCIITVVWDGLTDCARRTGTNRLPWRLRFRNGAHCTADTLSSPATNNPQRRPVRSHEDRADLALPGEIDGW